MPSPVSPQPAATVILIRGAAGEPSVYLMRRSLKSRFMAGSFVSPGGKVDREDDDAAFWADSGDLNAMELSARLMVGGSGDQSLPTRQPPLLAYAVAAIRETWEEAGVLLADVRNGASGSFDRLHARREGPGLDIGWLRSLVENDKGALAYSRLWPWAHWIAPEAFKQRFDTRFFVAFMPAGQTCRPDPRETPEGRWMTPKAALDANTAGEIRLSPPTLVTLHTLLAYDTVDALKVDLPRPDWGPALLPKMVFPPVGPMVIQPWDANYDVPEGSLPEKRSEIERLPVGAAFSRLWNDAGTWRPLA